ncbi:MAG: hypothetical protein VZT48_13315 [Bulleidia sp.]|nr:hypothetical protein [Bulleidia sp.]
MQRYDKKDQDVLVKLFSGEIYSFYRDFADIVQRSKEKPVVQMIRYDTVPVPNRIGAAKGKIISPDNLDEDNCMIEALFNILAKKSPSSKAGMYSLHIYAIIIVLNDDIMLHIITCYDLLALLL